MQPYRHGLGSLLAIQIDAAINPGLKGLKYAKSQLAGLHAKPNVQLQETAVGLPSTRKVAVWESPFKACKMQTT